MNYYGIIETIYNGSKVKEKSETFNNPLQAQAWITCCLRQAKELKVKVTDHYVVKLEAVRA